VSKWAVTVPVGRRQIDRAVEEKFGQEVLRANGIPFFAGFLPDGVRLLSVGVFVDARDDGDARSRAIAIVNEAAKAAGVEETWDPGDASATEVKPKA
jgi:hypothetical protein